MAVEGACWYDRNVEGLPAPTGDDQYVRFGEPSLHGFIRWVGELFSVKTPELRRQTIVAAIYGTWVKNEREAPEVLGRGRTGWRRVRRERTVYRPRCVAQSDGREAGRQERTEARQSVPGLRPRLERLS
jgi:hypothetical protein